MSLYWKTISEFRILHADFRELTDVESLSLIEELCDLIMTQEDGSCLVFVEFRLEMVNYSKLNFTAEQYKKVAKKVLRSCYLISNNIPKSAIDLYLQKSGSNARFFQSEDECYDYLLNGGE